MSYSKSVSDFPPFIPFSASIEASTQTQVKIMAGRDVGDPQSVVVEWTGEIIDDQFVLTNDLNSSVSFTIPIGSHSPTMVFDINNNPTVAYVDSGFIKVQSLGLTGLVNGKLKTVNLLDLAEIAFEGRTPKLTISTDSSNSVVQLFAVCPVGAEDYLCCFELSQTPSLVICVPTTVSFKQRIPSIPDTLTADTVYEGPNWELMSVGLGVPYTAPNLQEGRYVYATYEGLLDFNVTFLTPPSWIQTAGSKVAFILSDTGIDHTVLLTVGSYQPDSIYYVVDVDTATVEIVNTHPAQTSYSSMQLFPGSNSFFFENLTWNYFFQLGPFSHTVDPLPNGHTMTVMSWSSPGLSVVPVLPYVLVEPAGVLIVNQGDTIDYQVDGGPVQTYTSLIADNVFITMELLMNQALADKNTNYRYYEMIEQESFFLDVNLNGINVEGDPTALKDPVSILFHLSTASTSFQNAFGSTVDFEFHTCGGFSNGGPGPGTGF